MGILQGAMGAGQQPLAGSASAVRGRWGAQRKACYVFRTQRSSSLSSLTPSISSRNSVPRFASGSGVELEHPAPPSTQSSTCEDTRGSAAAIEEDEDELEDSEEVVDNSSVRFFFSSAWGLR